MNWSRYNYLFQSSKYGYLLYNALSNSFAELDKEGYYYLKSVENKCNLDIENSELYDSLIRMKVLVENDKDEFYNIKYLTHFNRFYDKYLELTINPTLHCNFACAYCFEGAKPPIYMTEDVENNIIDFIQKNKQAENIHITWFGGEPLMAFNRIVSFTEKVKKLNISFTANMITNGYLLSDKVIECLDDLNIGHIQITIDGLADVHDQRRPLVSGKGTFDKIVNNIDQLKNKKPKYPIVIRVNIDKTNEQQYIDIFKFFIKRYSGRIYVTPGFVTEDHNCNTSDCLLERDKKVAFLLEQYKMHGLNVCGFYPQNYRYECPMRNPYHLVIGPEGELYKCWNDVGNPVKVVGSLVDKEKINKSLLTRYYTAGDALEDPKCRECFHFPTCGGGCPYLRIENEYNGKNYDMCDYIKGNLQEFLELHYEFKQKQIKKDEKL